MSNPWETCEHLNTKTKWMTWIRGMLRRGWSKYPVAKEYKSSKQRIVPILDEDGNQLYYKTGKKKGKPRMRYEAECECCGNTFPAHKLQVDHIVSAGSFTEAEHIPEYLTNLFCGKDNLQLLCVPCHEVKTHMDRYKLTWEEALASKKLIEKCKQKASAQKAELKKAGFSEKDISNADKRVECYRKLLGENNA